MLFRSVRLNEVEREVFRFEHKSELLNEHDALQRGTVGKRLDKHELLKIATGRFAIATAVDCQNVGQKYANERLIASCINNAIIDVEVRNTYAQTEGKRRSS